MVDCGGAAVAVLLRASRLRRDAVASNWWRVDADGGGVHGAAVSDLTISRRLPESF